MMRQVLGQMALQLEGQTAFLFRWPGARVGQAQRRAGGAVGPPVYPGGEVCYLQIRDPLCWRRMEVLGGIGYCEESELPRLYRETPVNSIWEGSGNIMCLDVMRVLSSAPAALELLATECAEVKRAESPFRSRMALQAAAAAEAASGRAGAGR